MIHKASLMVTFQSCNIFSKFLTFNLDSGLQGISGRVKCKHQSKSSQGIENFSVYDVIFLVVQSALETLRRGLEGQGSVHESPFM